METGASKGDMGVGEGADVTLRVVLHSDGIASLAPDSYRDVRKDDGERIASSDDMEFELLPFVSVIPTITKSKTRTIMENSKADSLSISQVLDNYFKGIYEGDIALLSSTFNKETLLFGDVKGQPYAKTLDEYLDGVKNRKSPKDSGQPFKGDIITIAVINSIAIAKVKVKMYAFNYSELLSFHKIDGRWLIVNKMITDVTE